MNKIDVKTLLTIMSAVLSSAGVIGTWAVMQYRVDALEESVSSLELRIKETEQQNVKQIEQIKCFICNSNDVKCPGCP